MPLRVRLSEPIHRQALHPSGSSDLATGIDVVADADADACGDSAVVVVVVLGLLLLLPPADTPPVRVGVPGNICDQVGLLPLPPADTPPVRVGVPGNGCDQVGGCDGCCDGDDGCVKCCQHYVLQYVLGFYAQASQFQFP